ncbi:MAG: FUSC family protein [Bacteroidetes bacterium]|nr:FUSC family protein [Bacteroidota bacterium]
MPQTRKLRTFILGQQLTDGIRVTLEIISPAIILSLMGQFQIGLTASLGALCISICDAPGPVTHKRNGMMVGIVFVFLMALITGLVNAHILLLGILILVASFFFTMISVYGSRAGSIGTAALLIMVLKMTNQQHGGDAFLQSLYILAGGVWYMIWALLFYRLLPYRAAQRVLGECVTETANYLFIKSRLYDTFFDIEVEYKKLLEQQIIVNEKQNEVREILFKSRIMLKESTDKGRALVLTFVTTVQLFEDIMATWYDYGQLRKNYGGTGILLGVSKVIQTLANELKKAGEAIHNNHAYTKDWDILPALNELKEKIDGLSDQGSTIMLKKILVNLRALGKKTDELQAYFNREVVLKRKLRSTQYYLRFVNPQRVSWVAFKNNFTFKSSVFRHALRMMITCGVGFIIGKFFTTGHHSYWIIMTIIIILKPGFSLTKKKNHDRLLGTIAGGVLGLIVLAFIKNEYFLFALLFLFMLGTYTFIRINYILMVLFVTPYVMILFHFLGIGAINVASERLLDTAIASLLAFLASYFLFPQWESGNIKESMSAVVKSNLNYLKKLKELAANNENVTPYNLARKDVMVTTANLSSALNRMLSEPKSKQLFKSEIYQYVVLNHILSSNIASLASLPQIKNNSFDDMQLKLIDNTERLLGQSYGLLHDVVPSRIEKIRRTGEFAKMENSSTNEQLKFIYKVSDDILQLTEKMVA